MHSWRKIVNCLLAAILLVVVLFLVWTNTYYHGQLAQQTKDVAESSLDLWAGTTEMRLHTVNEHINEILSTVYTATVVTTGSPQMSFESQRKCQGIIDDKLRISNDVDCFFLIDSESGWFLFSASSRTHQFDVALLKAFSLEHAGEYVTSLRENSWAAVLIGGGPYFLKSVRVGKYVAGAMCGASHFNLLESLAVLQEDGSCMFLIDGAYRYVWGKYDWSQEVRLGEEGLPRLGGQRAYVISTPPFTDCQILLAYRSRSLWGGGGLSPLLLLLSSLVVVGLLLSLSLTLLRKVSRPTRELLTAQQEIGEGNIGYRITAATGSQEYGKLYRSFNEMAQQIQNLRIESYDRMIREQENRLKMVRAQMKPHFYLNAITTIYNMTYQNRLEDIRLFAQALAKYTRYMLNIQSASISIGEELSHIRNYLKMQQIRFPGSVDCRVECTEETARKSIPFLVLFTPVENAFKHALDLYKPLLLRIDCRPGQRGRLPGGGAGRVQRRAAGGRAAP